MIYILHGSFIAVLIIIAVRDMKTMEIPNRYVVALGVLALGATILNLNNMPLWHRLLGMICVSLPLLIIAVLIPNAFGGGDIKLMAAAGLYLGFRLTLLSFFLAVLVGGVYGLTLLISKKKTKKEHFAFGPFLCGGCIIALLLGERILAWYFGQF